MGENDGVERESVESVAGGEDEAVFGEEEVGGMEAVGEVEFSSCFYPNSSALPKRPKKSEFWGFAR